MRWMMTLAAAALSHGLAHGACPPRAQLEALKAATWDVAVDAKLTASMLDCLADPDPAVRDKIGFEALQVWMRARKIDVPTMQAMRGTLLARLKTSDAAGFAQPFAALALAEVVRADRLQPYLTAAQRSEIVDAAAAYLSAVRDYRGLDQKEGWRHGVAHGADLMLQLALNPAIGAAEQRAMLGAITTQLKQASARPHFFQYGEGERLMAPVFYIARRATLELPELDAWFAALAASPNVPGTQHALAHRHNMQSFLLPLYVSLAEGKDAAQRERMLPIVTKALRQLD
jgi:hypothetical protein